MNRIVLDTETANSLEEPLCYDIGYAVVDDDFNVIKAESFAVAEIFLDKELMTSAYYAEKIPAYWDDIKNGDRKLARLATILKTLRADIKAYGITEIYAHNMRFDHLSTKLTERYLTCSKYRYFFPFSVKICDTLKMSRQVFGKDKEYQKFCEENGYMTKHKTPRVRLTAEIIYRYLTGDNDFIEAHQGLADVLIEKEILKACLAVGADGAMWD
jgi:hypothetical protein